MMIQWCLRLEVGMAFGIGWRNRRKRFWIQIKLVELVLGGSCWILWGRRNGSWLMVNSHEDESLPRILIIYLLWKSSRLRFETETSVESSTCSLGFFPNNEAKASLRCWKAAWVFSWAIWPNSGSRGNNLLMFYQKRN